MAANLDTLHAARRKRYERYNASVLRGRNPRSMPYKSDIWTYIKKASERAVVAKFSHKRCVVNKERHEKVMRKLNNIDSQFAKRRKSTLAALDPTIIMRVNENLLKGLVTANHTPKANNRMQKQKQIIEYEGASIREEMREENSDRSSSFGGKSRGSNASFRSSSFKRSSGKTKPFKRKSGFELVAPDRSKERLEAELRELKKDIRKAIGVSHEEHEGAVDSKVDKTETNPLVSHLEVVELASGGNRLFYQAQVALEIIDGHFLAVHNETGEMSVLKGKMHADTKGSPLNTLIVPDAYTVTFSLTKLDEPGYAGPISDGSQVFIAVREGPGKPHAWKHGSVLGAQVKGGAEMGTVGISGMQAREPSEIKENIGTVAPISAYVPYTNNTDKSKRRNEGLTLDDLKSSGSSIQRIRRLNSVPQVMGKWTLHLASNAKIAEFKKQSKAAAEFAKRTGVAYETPSQPIDSSDAIYLEQDWFFLSTQQKDKMNPVPAQESSDDTETTENNLMVSLRQLPNKPVAKGSTCVDRRGVWKIRMVETAGAQNDGRSSVHGAGNPISNSADHMMYQARKQLDRSEGMRKGDRVYTADYAYQNLAENLLKDNPDLEVTSGEDFTRRLRNAQTMHSLTAENIQLKERTEEEMAILGKSSKTGILIEQSRRGRARRQRPVDDSDSSSFYSESSDSCDFTDDEVFFLKKVMKRPVRYGDQQIKMWHSTIQDLEKQDQAERAVASKRTKVPIKRESLARMSVIALQGTKSINTLQERQEKERQKIMQSQKYQRLLEVDDRMHRGFASASTLVAPDHKDKVLGHQITHLKTQSEEVFWVLPTKWRHQQIKP